VALEKTRITGKDLKEKVEGEKQDRVRGPGIHLNEGKKKIFKN